MDSSPKSVLIEYYDTSHIQLKSDSVMNRLRKVMNYSTKLMLAGFNNPKQSDDISKREGQ